MRKWPEMLVSLVKWRPNPPVALEEREGKSCLSYGFDAIENDGARDFRWSRRFFGFLVKDAPVREVALVLASNHQIRLSVSIDDFPVQTVVLKVGDQIVTARPARGVSAGVTHVAFALENTWRAPNDVRNLGIQLLGLRVTRDCDVICYAAATLSHNAGKSSWHGCGRHFAPKGDLRQRTGHNAKLNVEERTGQLDRVKSTPLKLYLETAWLCNLRCPSCFQAYLTPDSRKAGIHFMSPFLFRKVAEQLFPGAMMV
jgi:hypothetical protein